MKRNFNLIAIIFALVSVVFTTCDMDLFSNKYLPSSLQGDVTVTVPPGPVTVGTELTADYDGYEPVEYQWYKDGVPIPPPEGTKKTFTPTEAGSYTVGVKAPTRGEKISHPPIIVVGGHSTGTDLTGTLTRSPAGDAVTGVPITITYTPGPGEVVNVSELTYEWLIETPPPAGNFVSVSTDNPFTPTTPGTYKIRATCPSTGRVREKIVIIGDPPTPNLTGDVGITGTGKTGEPLTATYSGSESPVTYEWFREVPPPTTLVSSSNPFTPTEPGTYVVRVTVPGRNPKVSEPGVVVTATGGLTGIVGISPTAPTTGDPVTVTYVPAPGEPTTFPDGYDIEWLKGPSPFTPISPPPSPSNPYTPTEPGEYKVVIKDPTTGRVREEIIIVTDPTPTGNLFLNSSATPINSTTYTVTTAVAYVNANASASNTFTLKLSADCTAANLTLNADAKLVLEGVGGVRTVQFNGTATQRMFYINGNDASLTIRSNITLQGNGIENSNYLVGVANGEFKMEVGSKITGHNHSGFLGSVNVMGENAVFTMTGGEISGNNTTQEGAVSNSGVTVRQGVFNMSSGKIINNTRSNGILSGTNADVQMLYSSTTFVGLINLSGTAEIGVLSLFHQNTTQCNQINLNGAFSGTVGTLHLAGRTAGGGTPYDINDTRGVWVNKQIITATGGGNIADFVSNRLQNLGQFRTPNGTLTSTDIAPIADTHFIDTDGVLKAGGMAHARGNLYLNPNLTTPVLSNVTPSEAIDHVNANTNGGLNEYTLKMHGSGSVYNVQNINTNAKITIMSNVSGAGGERILTYNQSTGTMFRLQGTGLATQTLLTLGENITLTGSSNAQLVHVVNGTFTMLDGSKISGFSSTGNYAAVEVTNTTGRFIMEGGSITGNSTAGTSANAAGGVHVRSSGGFTMSGGTIIGNTRGGSIPSDIFMEYTLAAIARFTISDNAVIDHLILHARSATQYNNIWSGDLFSGRIEHVYLYFDHATMSNVISTWLDKTVIQHVSEANIIAIRDRITTVSFLNNTGATQNISGTHYINASGVLTALGGNLFLNGSSTPVTSTIYTVATAIAYVNSNASAGVYTLQVRQNENITTTHILDNNARLILESSVSGSGGERTITYTGSATTNRMFRINGDASLTLGNNITLIGRNGDSPLISVTYGNLIMLDGSKITGQDVSDNASAVFVSSSGTFTMEGGAITGNNSSSAFPLNAGGVVIQSSGTFIMNGGNISGNTPRDVNASGANLTKTGGTIGAAIPAEPW